MTSLRGSVLSWFQKCCCYCKKEGQKHCTGCHQLLCEKCIEKLQHECRNGELQALEEGPRWTVLPPRGMENLGTTCYMASALQMLLHTPVLLDYFLSGAYKEHINTENVLGDKGLCATTMAALCSKYRDLEEGRWLGMQSFFYNYAKFNCLFDDPFLQHDGQEFLSDVLDRIHEDLNVAPLENGCKKYVAFKDQEDGETVQEVSKRFSEFLLNRDDSMIHDLFGGLYKNQTTCSNCNNTNTQFERFCLVPLPLPVEITRVVTVLYFPLPRGTPPRVLSIGLSHGARSADLRGSVARLVGIPDPNLIICNSKNGFDCILSCQHTPEAGRSFGYGLLRRELSPGDVHNFSEVLYCYEDNFQDTYTVNKDTVVGTKFCSNLKGSPGWMGCEVSENLAVLIQSINVVITLDIGEERYFPFVLRVPIEATVKELKEVALHAMQTMTSANAWKYESNREITQENWLHPSWRVVNTLIVGRGCIDKHLQEDPGHIADDQGKNLDPIPAIREFVQDNAHHLDGDYGEFNNLKQYLTTSIDTDRDTLNKLSVAELGEYLSSTPAPVDYNMIEVRSQMEKDLVEALEMNVNHVVYKEYVLTKPREDAPLARYIVQSSTSASEFLMAKPDILDSQPENVLEEYYPLKSCLNPDIYNFGLYRAISAPEPKATVSAYSTKTGREPLATGDCRRFAAKLHTEYEETSRKIPSYRSGGSQPKILPAIRISIDELIDSLDLIQEYNSTGLPTLCKNVRATYLSAYKKIVTDKDYRASDSKLINKSPKPLPLWNWDAYMFTNPYVMTEKAPTGKQTIDIKSILRAESQPELIHDDNSWKCDKCQFRGMATVTHSIWSCGPYLLINLKRFSYLSDSGVSRKNSLRFDYPDNGILDLSEFISEDDSAIYEIYAAIIHMGTLEGGHYITILKSGDKWYKVDDEVVEEIENIESHIVGAYTIALRKYQPEQESEGNLKNEGLKN